MNASVHVDLGFNLGCKRGNEVVLKPTATGAEVELAV